MNTLKKDVLEVAKALKALTRKIEKIQRQVDKAAVPAAAKAKKAAKRAPVKKKAPAQKAPAKKKAVKKAPAKKATAKKPATATDTALSIIRRSKKGVTNAEMMKKTGFNQKKVANLFFKLKKQGKIKSKGKGLYVKA